MFLGIEIGGTKLQLGLGRGHGTIASLWRGTVDRAAGGEGIRRQIVAALPELLKQSGIARAELRGAGCGFGGPTDDATQSVIKSHHIDGWDGFPLAAWLGELTGLPTAICNDADVAGLAETHFGAGRGVSPVFYMTVGTGIGGGLCIGGEIYRGCGRGAVEVGHLLIGGVDILESYAAGWGIEARGRAAFGHAVTGQDIAAAARRGEANSQRILDAALAALAEAIQQVVKLLCPRRIIIGGGVSLMGDDLFFAPLRRRVEANAFPPFRGLTEIVPAGLGEDVVVHGALLLARKNYEHKKPDRGHGRA